MKFIFNMFLTAALASASIATLASDEAPTLEVKALVDGVIVASAVLPSGVEIKLEATSISSALNEPKMGTTLTGNATLVATVSGKEIMALKGDQIVVSKVIK
jgi:hypothetical protein